MSATLDHAAYWKAVITADTGDVLATATGRGTKIGVSWDGVLANGLPALPGMTFRYTITADDRVHGVSDPRSGTFEGGMPNLLHL